MTRNNKWNRSGRALPPVEPDHTMLATTALFTRQPVQYIAVYPLRFEAYLLGREKSSSTIYRFPNLFFEMVKPRLQLFLTDEQRTPLSNVSDEASVLLLRMHLSLLSVQVLKGTSVWQKEMEYPAKVDQIVEKVADWESQAATRCPNLMLLAFRVRRARDPESRSATSGFSERALSTADRAESPQQQQANK